MANSPRMIDQIPIEVRDYLTAGDGLGKAAVMQQHPQVEQTLRAPNTRVALVNYLSSREPWQDPPALTIGALAHLQNGASEKESVKIRPLAKHPEALVRLRVDEYLMAIYYPGRDEAQMANLFQEMLQDRDEIVRVQSARWIQGLKLGPPMRVQLNQWAKLAVERKWDRYESFEIIQGLLK
jgi:hypothetical protein